MTRGWLGLGSLVVVASLATACSGGDGAAPLTEDQFCDQKAQKECQVPAMKCGTVPAACVAQRKAKCLEFAAASKSAVRVFRPENVAKCVNTTNSVYAKATILPADLASMNDACNYVFQGNSEATCTVTYDCKGTNICDKGLCAAKVVKAKDMPCGNAGEVCATGSYCGPDPVTNAPKCLAKVIAGGACDETKPCVEAQHCAGGTCMPRLGSNETCINDDDCSTMYPYCDPYTGKKCDVGLSFAPTAAAACADYGGGAPAGTGGSSGNDSGAGGTTGGTDAATD